jgi:hypothetical protein
MLHQSDEFVCSFLAVRVPQLKSEHPFLFLVGLGSHVQSPSSAGDVIEISAEPSNMERMLNLFSPPPLRYRRNEATRSSHDAFADPLKFPS